MKKIYKLISSFILICFAMISNVFSQATQTYNATTVWNCPNGISSITVQCWGAGGAGGGNSTNADGGGGGGGGAYSEKVISGLSPISYPVTVGVGGSGVAGGNGNAGTNSWFGSLATILAKGGGGGFAPVGGAAGVGGLGGASGSGVGTIKNSGGIGGYGVNAAVGQGGPGGSSAGTAALANGWSGSNPWTTVTASAGPAGSGIGGNGGVSNGNGSIGTSPGGGGGGAGDENPTNNRIGGAGANGRIILIYPSISSFSPTFACVGSATLVTITGTNLTGASSVKFNGVNAPSFTVVNSTTVTVTLPAGASTGLLSVYVGANIAYSLSNFTVSPIPVPVITPNYCTGGGFVSLQATLGFSAYLWNTGATTSLISVNQSGNYSVSVTSAAGCTGATSISIGNELVVNGNFSSGNTGFTSAHTYTNQLYSGGTTGLWIEGKYTVAANPTLYHPAFFGTDHTTGTGNFMIINGDPATGSSVWSENVTVTPNTTYYFSAWGLSVVNGNNAVLQFNVNGLQVGTVAYLPDGYVATSGPYNWVKFYGSWNSGPATSATISIVDLQTILGGNDFALDDISFGTLSPVSLAVTPDANGNDGTCIGNPLVMNANGVGGASPFTYLWSGPSGYSSTLANPTVTASASAVNNGTYAITVTDGFGCTVSSTVNVTINPLPTTSLAITAVPSTICSGTSTNINVALSQTGVIYQLRIGTTNVGNPIAGTGGTISLPTDILNSNTTFNVLASNATSDCNVQLSTTPTITVNTTPVLVITNQTICTGTVDLTLAAVTAGSTGGGTLSYWTNAAGTIALTTPPPAAVNVNGTYYIKTTTAAGCTDIDPVVVNIGAVAAGAAFSYPTTPYCSSEADPLPTLTGGAFADVFSSTAGLVFVSPSTGQIDLSACTAGTYTVTLTMTPGGACPVATRTTAITITASPIATFSYATSGICQSVNAINPSPIFTGGAAAGTFTSSSGLLSIAANGVIDIALSTPGNYAVVNTRTATGGCLAVADTEFIDINPYTFTGALTASSSTSAICLGQSLNLYSSATSYLTVLERENFNGAFNSWSVTDNAGSPASATWTLRPNGYNTGSGNINSNDNSQFYLSNSQVAGSTSTYLQSPVMSTLGFSTLSLEFYNYFDARNSGDNIKVDVSTNGSVWTNIYTYGPTNTDIGANNGFVATTLSLNAYLGQPTLYVRFLFTASNDRVWAIDNITISGTSDNYAYNWTSSPVGFTSTDNNPTGVAPVVNTFYVIDVTNEYGCSNTTSPVPVTVNPNPTAVAGTNSSVCSGSGIVIGNGGTVGNTYSWSPSTGLSSSIVSNPNASPIVNSTYTLTETVTATGCSASNSVTVTVNPTGQWLGTVSSDWNNPLNWCGGVPTPTTDVIIPTGVLSFEPSIFNAPVATCHNLNIQFGHTITISAGGNLDLSGAITIGGTFTHTGGTLKLNGTAPQTLPAITVFNLLINNTNGSGVTLTGDLTVNGDLTIDASYLDVTPAIKTLNIAGNITLQNAGYFFDNCLSYLNIITSNATAAQTFTGNAQTIKCLNLTSVKTAGSLTLVGAAGNSNLHIGADFLINHSGTAILSDNGNTITVGDDVQLGGATSTNANFNFTGTLLFDCALGSTDIHLSDFAGSAITVARLNNVTINPAIGAPITTVQIYPLISTAQTVFFNGNLSVLNTNSLNPVLNSNSNLISLKGNWSDYAATGFIEGTGQVSFAGTAAAQTITGAEVFNKLQINNANGVSINNLTTVSTELILTNGTLTTGANEVQVTSNAVAAISGYSTASYVVGNLRRNVASTGIYNFPVGNANYQLATVKLNSSTGMSSILAFFNSVITGTAPSYPSTTINGDGIYGVLNSGFWTITPDAYTAVDYDITLNQRGYSNFAGNANQLGVIKRANSASLWGGTSLAGSNGFHSNATQSIGGGTATAKRTSVTSFSDFAEGFGGSPLPVELTTFTAKAVDNKQVDLFWNTQAELNCKYFSVQRSADGSEFSELGKVMGNGTSQISHDYTFIDQSPLCSIAYYRLMQVDENGEIHYTPIATATINCSTGFSVYPNPSLDHLMIDLSSMKADNSVLKIIGIDGKIYIESMCSSSLLKLDVSKLPAGFYFVNINNGSENLNSSFIKE
ncbi:hypothetical protein LBMAG27_09500 [Bacteroidota bacterium]|nr:hypothetical protein LBMAG27_09500 [Bacteroidota bacterium]